MLLHIIDVSAGENIEDKVFMTMEACDALLVFGSRDYGEDTGNPASTYHEIKVSWFKSTPDPWRLGVGEFAIPTFSPSFSFGKTTARRTRRSGPSC